MWDSLTLMLVKRWYVFTFLLAYLIIGSTHWGWWRTLKFLVFGYWIAWASEASSIRNGFPYGFYYYHYDALAGEPLLFGVPLWDSLSYTFLSFSGYMMAFFVRSRWDRHTPLADIQKSWRTVFWGAFFTMVLDIVIDPVAHLGSQWFLGDLYHYPAGARYFDVPLSNFAGWFLVSLVIISVFRLSDRLQDVPRNPKSLWLGVGLYWGIYLFNLGVTLYIAAWWLALASAAWGGLVLLLSGISGKKGLQELS